MTTKALQKDEIEFDKWSTDSGRLVKVRRRGRLFHIGGEEVVLFPISVMAESIDRDVKTLRRWEREKIWPLSQWKVPDKRCKRWYSSNQIARIRAEYVRQSRGGDFGFSHSPYFPLETFLKTVRDIFYKCDAAAVAMARKTQAQRSQVQ